MGRLIRLTALVACLCVFNPAGAAEIRERIVYFPVSGTTLAEIDRSLARSGVLIGSTGHRHPGATEVRFDGRPSYRMGPSGCRVGDVRLRVDLVTRLPRWTPSRRANGRTIAAWMSFERRIRLHEQEHAQIAKLWAAKLERDLRALSPEPSCGAMERKADALSRRYLKEHDAAQTRLDAEDGRRLNWRLIDWVAGIPGES